MFPDFILFRTQFFSFSTMNKCRQKINSMCMCLTHYNCHRIYTILAIISYTIFTCVADLDFCWHIQRCELFQTKMTSSKIFLVLVVHEGKNNYSLVLVLVKMEYYIFGLVSILKWWTPLLKCFRFGIPK